MLINTFTPPTSKHQVGRSSTEDRAFTDMSRERYAMRRTLHDLAALLPADHADSVMRMPD